jgi:hypothetical protein
MNPHNGELHRSYSSLNIISMQEMKNAYRNFGRKPESKRPRIRIREVNIKIDV